MPSHESCECVLWCTHIVCLVFAASAGEEITLQLRDLRSCCFLSDKRDTRETVASVALSAVSCDTLKSSDLPSQWPQEPLRAFSLRCQETFPACVTKRCATNSFTYLINTYLCLLHLG